MSFLNLLDKACENNNSLLCVGLDIDISKLPRDNRTEEERIFEFNKKIIELTKDFVCAYKPNIAFYEMNGIAGMQALIKTIEYIPEDIPVILDAKRGDIGHTAKAYAKSAFEVFNADAVTVNPYLGYDSLEPFINYQDKGVFVLCLTSNKGSSDFQLASGEEVPLYRHVAENVSKWNTFGNCGLVVGATNSEMLKEIRSVADDMPILIPGVGAQGGDLESSVKYGTTKDKNRAIINSSRGIIYADDPAKAAKDLRDEINRYR
ncbi:MAG: orotidine-5'-phosphate decarboxylase [Candidatus Margulisiibacteriota bacterium]